MPKYAHLSVVSPDDSDIDAVRNLLCRQFSVADNLTLQGAPQVVMTSVFEVDEKNIRNDFSEEELRNAIQIGWDCFFDSSEAPAFPNHPVKLNCVKVPGKRLGQIVIGDRVCLQGTSICCYKSVKIGSNVIFAPGVVVMDCSGHGLTGRHHPGEVDSLVLAPVVIEDDVWIGYGVMILPGVTIGAGAVIGAGSVVCQNIPSHSIAAGNPCKVIRSTPA